MPLCSLSSTTSVTGWERRVHLLGRVKSANMIRDMCGAKQSAIPTWLRVVVWSVAIVLALVGMVLAVVSSSFWPLIAFAGLAVPIGSMRPLRRASADPR